MSHQSVIIIFFLLSMIKFLHVITIVVSLQLFPSVALLPDPSSAEHITFIHSDFSLVLPCAIVGASLQCSK